MVPATIQEYSVGGRIIGATKALGLGIKNAAVRMYQDWRDLILDIVELLRKGFRVIIRQFKGNKAGRRTTITNNNIQTEAWEIENGFRTRKIDAVLLQTKPGLKQLAAA